MPVHVVSGIRENGNMSKVIVIGAGFSGISAACFLAKQGFDVEVVDIHLTPGGRARQFKSDGFTFDMGPSWYWMPDVFDGFFQQFGKNTSDYYHLQRLDPSYRIIFKHEDWDVPADMEALIALFERVEPGSGKQLETFLEDAAYKYHAGMQDMIYKPGLSITEFMDKRLLSAAFRLQLFSDISSLIRSKFKDSRLIEMLEFPVLFLGAKPSNTPALYSLMNYADMKLGTWYPKGGMVKIVEAMYNLALELGVKFSFGQEVKKVSVENRAIKAIHTTRELKEADIFIAAGDYHHFEQFLLPKKYQSYTPSYWENRKMAPSSLIYYVGVNTRLPNTQHHNLYFDADFDKHAACIYDHAAWPEQPLFYLSCTSKSDNTAPEGCENLFILIPTAPGLVDTQEIRNHYFNLVSERILSKTNVDIRKHLVFKKSFAYIDFVKEYHSFKGNAYGLANTLKQTAFLKPKIKSKKLNNLYYTGQLTVPGPGVPPSIISGPIVAGLIIKNHQAQEYESTI